MTRAFLGVPAWVWAGWIMLACVLLLRAGRYPAALTGDEIWFADSAWHLIHEGILRRSIHPDAVGSALHDYLPPLVTLLQAGSFLLFGLDAVAVGVPSAAVTLASVMLVHGAARRAGAKPLWAGAASLGLLALQIDLRALLYIRYEGLVLALFLAAWCASRRACDQGSLVWPVVAGTATALAGLAYYPLAPFVALALVPTLCAMPRRGWPGFVAGFAVPAALFALWVAQAPEVFAAQILSTGAGHYAGFELIRRFLDPTLWQPRLIAIESAALVLALALCWRFKDRLDGARTLLWAAFVFLLPAFLYPFQPRLLAPSAALILVMLARLASAPDLARWFGPALAATMVAAGANLALITVTTLWQWRGRDYARVTTGLDRLLVAPGPAAIDQRAWLAMRSSQPDRPILQIMPAGAPAQARVFEATVLSEPFGAADFVYLVLDRAQLGSTIAATPALKAAFAQNVYREVGTVTLPFAPLPWAPAAPYDLVVYQRQPVAPGG